MKGQEVQLKGIPVTLYTLSLFYLRARTEIQTFREDFHCHVIFMCVRKNLRAKMKFTVCKVAHKRKGDISRDNSQRRFLAQHSVATLLRHCFEWLQHCSNIAAQCCAKNRRCESSRVP